MQAPLSTAVGTDQPSQRSASSSLEQRLAGGANKGASDALAAAAGKFQCVNVFKTNLILFPASATVGLS